MGQMVNRRRVMSDGALYDAEVEYIESDGNSGIDTLINGGSNAEYELSVALTYPNNSRYAVLIDCDNAPSIYLQSGQTNWTIQWEVATKSRSVQVTLNLDVKYKLSFVGGKFYVDDLEVASPGIIGYGDYKCTLLRLSNNGRQFLKGARIYYCKMYKDGILVRDFIPVRKRRTGYMYDKVSEELFGNTGTGDFILGPDKT